MTKKYFFNSLCPLLFLTLTTTYGWGNENSLANVKFWCYQIQDINTPGAADALVNSYYDMVVLEPTRTDWSSDDKYFDTKSLITQIKNSKASDGIHRKLVLAYIDIGEAEDWRWYWTWSQEWIIGQPRPADWPDYIICHDPDGWSGNYPVAYWDSRWKDIIIYGNNQNSSPYGDYNSVIDEVIKDGFDGIYLDWVEAFEDENVMAAAQAAGKDPAVEMIAFIQEMKQYAAVRNPDFLIIQQNAASLIDGHPELTNVIDAIAQEAIWYDGDADVDWQSPDGYDYVNESSLVNYYNDYLRLYRNANIPVFDCEYALNYAGEAYSKSNNKGYIPYATRRSLLQLTTTPPPGYGSMPTNLLSVENFLYQLDNINLTAIGNTAFDLVIIDYSSDGEESGEFSAAQIDALKHSPGGEKIVISYMSIGEAEDYRFYWNNNWSTGNPSWLDEENPDWEGNYKVKYWDSNWQSIIFQYADRILNAGFDGVYLDIIDAYEYYEDRGRTAAAQDMVNFVASIAAHVRTMDPDFFIIPQNASELATDIPAYLNTVDGIGQEDIYYGYDDDGVATPADITAELETYLNVFKQANKLVMTVDYPFSNSEDVPHFDGPTVIKINNAYSKSLANGYIPYCSVRNLNYLTINPGFDPSSVETDHSTLVNREYKLVQNYPNPFNPETVIEYHLPKSSYVEIAIYNLQGQRIITLLNKYQSAGLYHLQWNGKNEKGQPATSGVYVYQFKAGKYISARKMMLLR